MRFALLGDHPDGLEMARALVATGRHELGTYTGPGVGAESLRRLGLRFTPVRDLEEVLADPSIEAIIVASRVADRPNHLRRALQSERHVLCVHPADQTPDIAYEAAMIQGDSRCVLLPLLPDALHPAVLRLAELARQEAVIGTINLVRVELMATAEVLLETGTPGKLSLPGWDILRAVGGEVAEISAFAAGEHLVALEPLLVAGRFERGGLFQACYLPGQQEAHFRMTLLGSYTRVELVFPVGWPGPAHLSWQDETGTPREEHWDAWNPWPALVETFEAALAAGSQPVLENGPRRSDLDDTGLTWQTAIRALELDDAARRSLQRRRVSTLEYPEPTEEVGFKGTMTLVGCGLFWVVLVLAILSSWFPRMGWLIGPVLVFFLGLQVLRWLVPAPRRPRVRAASERKGSKPS